MKTGRKAERVLGFGRTVAYKSRVDLVYSSFSYQSRDGSLFMRWTRTSGLLDLRDW